MDYFDLEWLIARAIRGWRSDQQSPDIDAALEDFEIVSLACHLTDTLTKETDLAITLTSDEREGKLSEFGLPPILPS